MTLRYDLFCPLDSSKNLEVKIWICCLWNKNKTKSDTKIFNITKTIGNKVVGDPGRIRTCDLQIRNLLLYPAELRGHVEGVYHQKIKE